MKKQITKFYILLLLAVLFAAPGITAYVFFQHPDWLGSAKVNKGTLLNPPLVLKSLEGKGKWRIVYWSPNACDKTCLQHLDTLARIRLALGRKLYQVDQWLILGDKAPSLSQETKSFLKDSDFHMAQVSSSDEMAPSASFADAKVFLANPDNFLILSYSSQVNPDDVYKDLKLLLNNTQK